MNTTFGHKQEKIMATGPLSTHLTDLVCMQITQIMQLENLEQFLSNKKQGDEYMGSLAARLLIQVI